MSDFIQIPNKIQEITKKSKAQEAYAYGLIRNQIKDNSYTARISEIELAKLGGWSERTSRSYVKDLKEVGLILSIEKEKGKGDYSHNVYRLEKQNKGYSLYRPDFFSDPNLTSGQKGLLMLLKSYCIPGTRHMPYPSAEAISKMLKMDSDVFRPQLRELESLHQVKKIDKSLVLTNPNILLATDMTDYRNWSYEIIYRFCLLKGVVPPTKNDTESKNLGFIAADFPDPRSLLTALVKRFKTLPKQVTLSYFAQGLRNMHAKAEPPKPPIIL